MSEATVGRDNFRWVILGLISVSHIIGATAQYGINTLAPFYKDELGLSRAQVGLFFSAFYLAMAGFSFSAGRRADRLGVRKTTFQGHFFLGICTLQLVVRINRRSLFDLSGACPESIEGTNG